MTGPGWRQAPVPVRPKCLHLGAAIASLSLPVHPGGHEWVCGCGQVFMVVSDAGKNRRLVLRERSNG